MLLNKKIIVKQKIASLRQAQCKLTATEDSEATKKYKEWKNKTTISGGSTKNLSKC